jgi:hypothetical protein
LSGIVRVSLEIALTLLFAGAAWTHVVASAAEDEGARRHYKLVSGAIVVAIIAGVLAATIAFEALGERHLEHMPSGFRWFGFAVGVSTYLWTMFHDIWRKKPPQERQPLTPSAAPSPLDEMLSTPPDAPLVEIAYRWQRDPLGKPPASAATTPPGPSVSAPASSATTPPPSKQEN